MGPEAEERRAGRCDWHRCRRVVTGTAPVRYCPDHSGRPRMTDDELDEAKLHWLGLLAEAAAVVRDR